MIKMYTLKKYFCKEGYGFINCPGIDGDIYFRGEEPDGRYVSFKLIETRCGMRADNLTWLRRIDYSTPILIDKNNKIVCGYDETTEKKFSVGTLFDGSACIQKDATGFFNFFDESECQNYRLKDFIQHGAGRVISSDGVIEIKESKDNRDCVKLKPSGKFFETFVKRCDIKFENAEAEKRCRELEGDLFHTVEITYDLAAQLIMLEVIHTIRYKCELDQSNCFDEKKYNYLMRQQFYGSLYEEFFNKSVSHAEMHPYGHPYDEPQYYTKYETIRECFATINVEDGIERLFAPLS